MQHNSPKNDATSDTEIDLAVPLRTVCYIAERAHDLMGKTASTEPEGVSDDEDPENDILEDRGHDPVREELTSLIDDIDVEGQVDLVALMWLGREDEDWNTLQELAWQERTPSPASYLLGTPLLADYLWSGLNRLGLDCKDLEP